jgi:hypothetical protein
VRDRREGGFVTDRKERERWNGKERGEGEDTLYICMILFLTAASLSVGVKRGERVRE